MTKGFLGVTTGGELCGESRLRWGVRKQNRFLMSPSAMLLDGSNSTLNSAIKYWGEGGNLTLPFKKSKNTGRPTRKYTRSGKFARYRLESVQRKSPYIFIAEILMGCIFGRG